MYSSIQTSVFWKKKLDIFSSDLECTTNNVNFKSCEWPEYASICQYWLYLKILQTLAQLLLYFAG